LGWFGWAVWPLYLCTGFLIVSWLWEGLCLVACPSLSAPLCVPLSLSLGQRGWRGQSLLPQYRGVCSQVTKYFFFTFGRHSCCTCLLPLSHQFTCMRLCTPYFTTTAVHIRRCVEQSAMSQRVLTFYHWKRTLSDPCSPNHLQLCNGRIAVYRALLREWPDVYPCLNDFDSFGWVSVGVMLIGLSQISPLKMDSVEGTMLSCSQPYRIVTTVTSLGSWWERQYMNMPNIEEIASDEYDLMRTYPTCPFVFVVSLSKGNKRVGR